MKFGIRENITPRGDGNMYLRISKEQKYYKIRENITPRGDGNFVFSYSSPNISSTV